MKVEEALQIKNTDIAKYLKLPPVKLHCSMLAEEAIKKAIEDVKLKNKEESGAWFQISTYFINFTIKDYCFQFLIVFC